MNVYITQYISGTVALEYVASFNSDFNVLFYFYKIAFDFFNEFNPYLLLATCSHLRKKYLEMLGLKINAIVKLPSFKRFKPSNASVQLRYSQNQP